MTRYLTCAETARYLRAHLRREFPAIRFSVRSHTYSGGASIDVRWNGTPDELRQVQAIADQYQGATFDGMIDLKVSVTRWLLPDGTMTFAGTRGTEGSRGSIPADSAPKPHPDAEEVRPGADYIFCDYRSGQ